jgi:hypothetical protein
MNDSEAIELAREVESMAMRGGARYDEVQETVVQCGGWDAVWYAFRQSADVRVRRLGFTLRAARAIYDQAEVIADRVHNEDLMGEQYFIELGARAAVFAKSGRLDEASYYVETVANMLCVLSKQILRADPADEAAGRLLAEWSEIASVMQTR